MTLFDFCHFLRTLFTNIGPQFQTLIPNRALICQIPFKVRVLISIQLAKGLMRKLLKKFLNGIY